MAHGIRLKWYPPRNCWRVRKTIDGKSRTFYVGRGASGENDQRAYSAAFLEAERKIEHARRELAFERDTDIAAAGIVGIGQRLRSQAQELLDFLDQHDDAEVGIFFGAKAKGMDVELPLLLNDAVLLGQLDKQNTELRSRVEQLEAILESQGRAATLQSNTLPELASAFVAAAEAEAESRGLSAGHRRSFRGNVTAFVDWLGALPEPITENLDLDARQGILSEYREVVIEERNEEEYSAAWAKARLDKARLFCEYLVERQYLSQLPRGIGRHWSNVGKDLPSPTFLSVAECRQVWESASSRVKLAIALGLNCGYRQSDLLTLRVDEVNLEAREIRRQRNKTGAAQVHMLWEPTRAMLEEAIQIADGPLVLPRGWSNISREVSKHIKSVLDEQDGKEKRTAKSLRSTGAQMIETVLGHSMPHVVDQFLAHTDKRMAKHYRTAELKDLFDALAEAERRFALAL